MQLTETGSCSFCKQERLLDGSVVAIHPYPFGTGAPPPNNHCPGSAKPPLAEPLTCRCGHHFRYHHSSARVFCAHGIIERSPCECEKFEGVTP